MLDFLPIWLATALLFAAMAVGSVAGNRLNRALRGRSASPAGNDEAISCPGYSACWRC